MIEAGKSTVSSPKLEFLAGIRDELPLSISGVPFGMIYGVLALGAGLPPDTAQAMSIVVFAGSAQFISTQLFGVGAPGLVILLTIGIVNLRHALYSASLAPYLQKLSPLWKWLLAYLLTDEAYAVTVTHYNREGSDHHQHWYFLGAGLALWIFWQASTALGILLGEVIPAGWSLDFTLALSFIALVVPTLEDRASIGAAAAAGVTAIVAFGLPFKLGLVAASLTGMLVGVWMEARQ